MEALMERLRIDEASKPQFKVGDLAVLTRDFAGHKRGTHLWVVDLIECSTGDYLRFNAKAVYQDEPRDDPFFWRTFPAEHLRPVPRVGELTFFNMNQGDRPANCLAVIGAEALWEYEMPSGRTYLLIESIGGSIRSVSRNALTKKWRKAIEED